MDPESWEDRIHIVVSRKGEDSPVYEVKPEVGTGGNRILHRNLLLPCNYLPVDIPSKTNRKRERRVQKDKSRNVQQIPTTMVEDLSDGTSSEDECMIPLKNPHTGQTLEEVITEEIPTPSVEEKQPTPIQSEDATPNSGHQGEASSDNSVLEEMEEARSESGDEQDPPIQIDNSEPDAPELEPRPQRQRHPPTLLTYNTFGNPTYETQASTHFISANNVLGSQLPQYCNTCGAGLPAMQQLPLPTFPQLSQNPVIFGYPGQYLQYPSMHQPVFQYPVNQYPVHHPVVYQPRNELMQVAVTMNSVHVPLPGYAY